MRMSVPCVHVVGRKNHGKTTLASELVESLGARGLRVGAIKHTPHPHALDAEGSDSARLGGAGAAPWAFLSGAGSALFLQGARSIRNARSTSSSESATWSSSRAGSSGTRPSSRSGARSAAACRSPTRRTDGIGTSASS